MSVSGKIVVVTGAGQKRGIGGATARLLAERGATVVATDLIRPEPSTFDGANIAVGLLEDWSAEGAVSSGRIVCAALDVTDTQAVDKLMSDVVGKFGRIDVLFNNAGVALGAGPIGRSSDEDWTVSHDVNVLGTARACRAVLPHMANAGGGSIINNASLLGLVGIGGYSAYCATKFAIVGVTKSLADEFGTSGVRVNVVCAGYIDTELNDRQVAWLAAEQGSTEEGVREFQASATALGRLGQPEDVALAVAFLASDDAIYITGVALPVTGGLKGGL